MITTNFIRRIPVQRLMNTFPVVSVPAGISTQNMPIGMQIVGKPYDTKTVFRVAHAFSKGGPRLFTGDMLPKVQ